MCQTVIEKKYFQLFTGIEPINRVDNIRTYFKLLRCKLEPNMFFFRVRGRGHNCNFQHVFTSVPQIYDYWQQISLEIWIIKIIRRCHLHWRRWEHIQTTLEWNPKQIWRQADQKQTTKATFNERWWLGFLFLIPKWNNCLCYLHHPWERGDHWLLLSATQHPFQTSLSKSIKLK